MDLRFLRLRRWLLKQQPNKTVFNRFIENQYQAQNRHKKIRQHTTRQPHLIYERRKHHGKLFRQHERGSIRDQSP